MRTKRMLAVVLSVVMLVGMLGITAFAEDAVTLTVGKGKQFATLEEAFAEAVAKKYTNITYEIYGLQTLSCGYGGAGKLYAACAKPLDADVEEIHFVGKDKEAGIFVDDSTPKPSNSSESATTFITTYGTETVTFSDLTIGHNKSSVSVNGKGDRICSAWYVYTGDNLTYTNCKFTNLVMDTTKNSTYKNCEFHNYSSGSYALFYSGVNEDGKGGALVIDGCLFVGTRAIKTYSDDLYNGSRAVLSSMTVKDSSFTVNQKAAIENTGAFMEGAKTVITGNTFNYCKATNDAASIYTTDEEIAKNNQFDLVRPRADVSFTAQAPVYYQGDKQVEGFLAGVVKAGADVKNNLTKEFTVSMITAEYVVAENGVKTLVQVKKDTKVIPAGETVTFENVLDITEKEGHQLQTMLVADDVREPIGAAVTLLPGEEVVGEPVVYLGSETEENGIVVSTYQINRFGE
ncbi:MAG: hypothetical protein E7399_09400 [Ruminococcaceae bacterium]|nr:hypothetical protein [Oscillospiraceae bacterium]